MYFTQIECDHCGEFASKWVTIKISEQNSEYKFIELCTFCIGDIVRDIINTDRLKIGSKKEKICKNK